MVDQLVFVGFNSRVAAIDRVSGKTVWQWKSPGGSGYVSLLVDGDRLIVSIMGYTYSLDPATGNQLWRNDLAGMGTGVVCLASLRGGTTSIPSGAAVKQQTDKQSDSSTLGT